MKTAGEDMETDPYMAWFAAARRADALAGSLATGSSRQDVVRGYVRTARRGGRRGATPAPGGGKQRGIGAVALDGGHVGRGRLCANRTEVKGGEFRRYQEITDVGRLRHWHASATLKLQQRANTAVAFLVPQGTTCRWTWVSEASTPH